MLKSMEMTNSPYLIFLFLHVQAIVIKQHAITTNGIVLRIYVIAKPICCS